ncbi:ROK family transcriptional regulator [Microbacterium karelineae]|uniref:ROK family transcriptional regulator n=1 Tax=Microbacterium karelineae TaxID=2654283 RepID=UPI0012EA7DF2|nr:ROK family transcriptional regulator [Microbacterium karelineae]
MRHGDDAPRRATKLLPTDARAHNRSLVIETVLRTHDVSRADVARITGLSRITISELVGGLVDEGVIVESGARASAGRPGKPATLLGINPRIFATIAVDLSGPGAVRGAALALDGTELANIVLDGDARGEDAVARVIELVDRLASSTDLPIGGIGIGAPGIVDDAGVVLESTTLGWRGVPLASLIGERFSAPTRVCNDADAALASELAPERTDDLLLVRIGAGIGGAAFVGGRIVQGANFAAGEFAHVRTASSESGATTIEEELQALLREARRPGGQRAGTAGATASVEAALGRVGELIGHSLTPAVAMLDVPEVILDGPPGLDTGIIADAAQRVIMRERSLVTGRTCVVTPGAHGADAVLRGMADIVRALAISAL